MGRSHLPRLPRYETSKKWKKPKNAVFTQNLTPNILFSPYSILFKFIPLDATRRGLVILKIRARVDRWNSRWPVPKILAGKIRPPISPQRLGAQPAASNPSTGPLIPTDSVSFEIPSLAEVNENGFENRDFPTAIPEVGVARSTSG